jgi:hypothetical protein
LNWILFFIKGVVMFDRRSMARMYAQQHFATDPGTDLVLYLPKGSPEREIRLVEINRLIPERVIEPIDFGVERGNPNSHSLVVIDLTPDQWDRIKNDQLHLPEGWILEGSEEIDRPNV